MGIPEKSVLLMGVELFPFLPPDTARASPDPGTPAASRVAQAAVATQALDICRERSSSLFASGWAGRCRWGCSVASESHEDDATGALLPLPEPCNPPCPPLAEEERAPILQPPAVFTIAFAVP